MVNGDKNMSSLDSLLANINPQKPILLVDADEVLLRFIERLETYFLSQGYELRLTSFRLAGNVFCSQSGVPASAERVKQLIAAFFIACVDDIAPVQGAATGLANLSPHYQIFIVSNVPAACRKRREMSLARLEMPYPVVANQGNKGPIIQTIAQATGQKIVFIDDLPPQHASAARHCPESYRVHFVADKRLGRLIEKAPDAHIRLDDWHSLTPHLIERLKV